MSYQEAAWGTNVLKKLEMIHATVDPEQLFNCWDCVGYEYVNDGDSGSGGKHGKASPKTAKKESENGKKSSKRSKETKGKTSKKQESWEYIN